MKSSREKQSQENILRRNVHENTTNNFPSNILKNHSQFQTYVKSIIGSDDNFWRNSYALMGICATLNSHIQSLKKKQIQSRIFICRMLFSHFHGERENSQN